MHENHETTLPGHSSCRRLCLRRSRGVTLPNFDVPVWSIACTRHRQMSIESTAINRLIDLVHKRPLTDTGLPSLSIPSLPRHEPSAIRLITLPTQRVELDSHL